MTTGVGIDLELLKAEIKKTYATVSTVPSQTSSSRPAVPGRPTSGIRRSLRASRTRGRVVRRRRQSVLRSDTLAAGERRARLGSGAGTDSLVAAQMVGRRAA